MQLFFSIKRVGLPALLTKDTSFPRPPGVLTISAMGLSLCQVFKIMALPYTKYVYSSSIMT